MFSLDRRNCPNLKRWCEIVGLYKAVLKIDRLKNSGTWFSIESLRLSADGLAGTLVAVAETTVLRSGSALPSEIGLMGREKFAFFGTSGGVAIPFALPFGREDETIPKSSIGSS